MVFDNNDKPGVMLSGAVRAFAERYGVAPGKQVVICTNNDDAYKTAACLQQAGVEIVAIADARSEASAAAQSASASGLNVLQGHVPKKAQQQQAT